MISHRRLVLAGSAAHPITVRSEVRPMTYCRWVWDPVLPLWCYRCCDVYGCHYLDCAF